LHYSDVVEVARSLNGHIIRARMHPVVIHASIVAVRRLILATLCGLGALLVPSFAHADALGADLDGDGIHDRIEIRHGSRELAIRSSATRRWQRLPINDQIVRFVVTDVDRDGDPDLVANTRQSGVRVWINKGRGLFSARSGRLHSRHPRLARHLPRPAVRGVQTVRLDDSALNDSNRLLILWGAPARADLLLIGEAPVLADAPLPNVTYQRRPPRGPPTLLVS
jgi:hypothetical protein